MIFEQLVVLVGSNIFDGSPTLAQFGAAARKQRRKLLYLKEHEIGCFSSKLLTICGVAENVYAAKVLELKNP